MDARPAIVTDPGPAPDEPLPEPFAGWFAARGWQVRSHQRAMWRAAEAGRHALLIAPTGAGKTLAGFLPSLIALAAGDRAGLHTLYVSPLKALAVDIARNLDTPIREMGLPVRTETRTGDTPQKKKDRQRRDPPHILLTTPESLSLLLSYPDAARMFAGLDAIVIDELHAFVPTKRGQLLSLALARLERLAPRCRRVGLSATIHDEPAFQRWLAPGGQAETVTLVRGKAGPVPDIAIMVPDARIPWRGHTGRHALTQVYDAIRAHRTTLVFVNTRGVAERVFQDLWDMNADGLAIALHHGSLAREQRRKVEAAMARGVLRAVVCTASLDLGIDWGDVDLVIQIGAPKGASRLLQRIGRANHRLDEPSKALLVPGSRFEYLEAQAALDAVKAGALDGEAFTPGGLDVLAQHLLGMACAAPVDADALYQEVRRAPPYAALARADFDDALDFVATGGYALKRYDRYRRLRRQPDGRYRTSHPRVERQYRLNAGTIVSVPMLEVRFRRGRVLGQVEEWFAQGLAPGDTFAFGGRLLEFQALEGGALIVSVPKRAREPRIPVYGGSRMPLTTHLADRVRAMLEDETGWARFPADVRDWLTIQPERSALPDRATLLTETFPRGVGRDRREYLVAYCFEGRNAHQTLGMLLTRRMEKLGLAPMGFVATDYTFAIWSMKPVPDPAVLFTPDILEAELVDWMAESAMLKRTFRDVSTIAGLIDRKHPGAEKTGRQITFNADLIYDVLRRYDPKHVLLRATWLDATGRLTDVDRLADFLERVAGRVRHVALDRVSPLAVPVLLQIGVEAVHGAADDLMLDEAALVAEAMT